MKYILAASFALVGEAASEVYRKSASLVSAVSIPTIGIWLVSIFAAGLAAYPFFRTVLALATVPLYVIMATACHRIVLIGENSLPHRWGLFWTERETRFLGWFIGILFLYAGLSLPTAIILAIFSNPPEIGIATTIATFTSYVLVAYFQGRFSLVLPATAVDERLDFKKSWAMSRGKGMLIAIALVIPTTILVPIEILIEGVIADELSPIADLVWLLIALPIFAIEIAIISLAYDKLASQGRR